MSRFKVFKALMLCFFPAYLKSTSYSPVTDMCAG